MTKKFLRKLSMILVAALLVTSCPLSTFALDETQAEVLAEEVCETVGAADDDTAAAESFDAENIPEAVTEAIAEMNSDQPSEEDADESEAQSDAEEVETDVQSDTSTEGSGATEESVIVINTEETSDASSSNAEESKNSKAVELTAEAVDGVQVTVIAPEGALPEGATLSVTKVVNETHLKDIEAAVDNTQLVEDAQAEATGETDDSENQTEGTGVREESYTFDITIYDAQGNEVQPDDTVEVIFTFLDDTLPICDAKVYHLEENTNAKTANLQKLLNDALDGKVYSDEETEVKIVTDDASNLDGEVIDDLDEVDENKSSYSLDECDDNESENVTNNNDSVSDTTTVELKDTSLFARELETTINVDGTKKVKLFTNGFSTYELKICLTSNSGELTSDSVAKVEHADGTVVGYYSTFKDAFEAATESGDIITLLDSYTASEIVSSCIVNKKLVLELGDNVLTLDNSNAQLSVSYYPSELIINSSDIGGIEFCGSSDKDAITVSMSGKLELRGGNYTTYRIGNTTKYASVINNDNGLIEIASASLKSVGTCTHGIVRNMGTYAIATLSDTVINGSAYYSIYNSGTLTIDGSNTLFSSGSQAIYNSNAMNINGGEFRGTVELSKKSVTTIDDGIFVASDKAIINNAGSLTVKGGKITGKYGVDNNTGSVTMEGGLIDGSQYGIYNSSGSITITQGTIMGSYDGIYNLSGTLNVDGIGISISGRTGIETYDTSNLSSCNIQGSIYGIRAYNSSLTVDCDICGETYSGIYLEDCDLYVNGGNISSLHSYGINIYAAQSDHKTIFTGNPIVSGIEGSIYSASAQMSFSIDGGTFNDGISINDNASTIVINGGIFKSSSAGQYVIDAIINPIIFPQQGIFLYGSISINGGRFDNEIRATIKGMSAEKFISGGYFHPVNYIKPGKMIVDGKGVEQTVIENLVYDMLVDSEAILIQDDTQVDSGTLLEMMSIASPNQTVRLIADVNNKNNKYKFTFNPVTLDLDGHDIMCNSIDTELSNIIDEVDSEITRGVIKATDTIKINPTNRYMPLWNETGYSFFNYGLTTVENGFEYKGSKPSKASNSQIVGFSFVLQFKDKNDGFNKDSMAYDLLQSSTNDCGLKLVTDVGWKGTRYLFNYSEFKARDKTLLAELASEQNGKENVKRVSIFYAVSKPEGCSLGVTVRIKNDIGFNLQADSQYYGF